MQLQSSVTKSCSYCSGDFSFVKITRSKLAFVINKGVNLITPICGNCWNLLLIDKLPEGSAPSETFAMRELEDCYHFAGSLQRRKRFDAAQALIERLNRLSPFIANLESDFVKKANAAQIAMDKMQRFNLLLSKTQNEIASKMEATYEFCRKLANRTTASIEIREAVFERDGFKCLHCGSMDNLSIDHIRPVKLGGGNQLDNLQTLCVSCNSKKKDTYTFSKRKDVNVR